jgi:hypothetical protein
MMAPPHRTIGSVPTQHLRAQLRRPGEPLPFIQKGRISRFQNQLCESFFSNLKITPR